MPKVKDLKKKLLFTAMYLTVVAVFYFLPISCIFLDFLKIPCPGCGMTRAILCAFRLDFYAAFSHHLMFWSMPILYLYFLFDGRLFKNKLLNKGVFIAIAIGFLVNWILKFI